MEHSSSTFDKLVKSLSKEEIQTLLANISTEMKDVTDNATVQQSQDFTDTLRFTRKPEPVLSNEPFFVRFWISLKSFLTSIPAETLYSETLLKRLAKKLESNSGNYINIPKNIYITNMYDAIKQLRKTQVFFLSILSSYDALKGSFYMLLSSFVAPATYDKLMKETNPFSVKIGSEVSGVVRTNFLRKIDSVFSNLTDDEKSTMYTTAQGIEWMRSFSELSLDKILLRFSVSSENEAACPVLTIQPEIEILASLISSKKTIPHDLLQTLFFLQSQEKLTNTDDDKLRQKADEFIQQATEAISAINKFITDVPLIEIIRYVKKDITWVPYRIDGGEDWFIYFKQAWYERFNEKWTTWSYEQKKYSIKVQMLSLLKVEDLNTLTFSPWKNLWIECDFQKEFQFLFLKTFFTSFYEEKISGLLKTILIEGNFYRRESLAEYTAAYNVLEHRKDEFDGFEKRLAPDGDIGMVFATIRNEKMATLKNKNKIEVLMRTIESEAKQLITSTIESLKIIDNILNGIIGNGKTSMYATLTNWSNISGANGGKLKDEIENARNQIHKAVDLYSISDKLSLETK